MAKQKPRKKRRLIVAGGVVAGTGAAAAARAQRKRSGEPTSQSPTAAGESRMQRIADRARSWLDTGKEKATAVAHKLRHPSGTSTP